MNTGQPYDRMRQALRRELQNHRGHIHEIERQLSRSEGYLSKVCRGDISIPLEMLFKSLEHLGTEPANFFGRAFGTPNDPVDALSDFATKSPDRSLVRLLRSLDQLTAKVGALEIDEPIDDPLWLAPDHEPFPALDDATTATVSEQLAAFWDCPLAEQKRRLRATKRLRTTAFARGLIRELEARRQQAPRDVLKLTVSIGIDFLPLLEEPTPRQRLQLMLDTILAHGASRRSLGQHRSAAFALAKGLSATRELRLLFAEAEFLKRAGVVLLSAAEYEAALRIQERALVAFQELGQSRSVGKTLIDRAIAQHSLNRDDEMRRSIKAALDLLPVDDPTTSSFRSTAFQLLARSFHQRGEMHRAISCMEQVIGQQSERRGVNFAVYLTQLGDLYADVDRLDDAEAALGQARDQLLEFGSVQAALTSLSLIRVLLAKGRLADAVEIAREMTLFMAHFETDRATQAALVELIRISLRGELTLQAVEALQHQLERRSDDRRS
ncbi:MAG: hypothetical protein AAGN46_16755 [Acidobacteriota bacterium]